MASILIVDDELTTRLELDEMLTAAGYHVAGGAETGRQAVEMAGELAPDLILMDIVMPGRLDGISAAEIIKADSNIPIIFLSGYGDPEFVERAKRVEPFGYVMKPFDETEVKAFVEIALYKSNIERKLEASNRELQRLQKEWEGIFQAIGNPTVLLDAERRVIHANAATLKNTGLSVQEIIGMKCHEIFHNSPQPPKGCPYEKSITTGRFETCEMAFEALDGTFLVSYTPLLDPEGRVEKVIHIATDITARKWAEAENARLETELRQTRKMEMIGTLTGGIAHDYNNLLAIAMGNISLAKMEVKSGAPILAYLKNAENAALKTRDLTHKLMTLSEGGAPMRESGSIGSLLRGALEEMAPHENIECSLEISHDLWYADYDPTQMRYAISNVLINAREALPRGGVIHIQAGNTVTGDENNESAITSGNGKHVLIVVKDNGTGIPEEHLEKIFDPYFSTKERGIQKGMGLGLTTSDSIIRKHEGSIKVESVPSAGTTVSIYLPAAESEAFEEPKIEK